MTVVVRLALVLRDGFFCKDGRGWFTSASGRGHGVEWPWPSTLLGALRTAWGRAVEDATGARFEALNWQKRTAAVELGRTLALRRAMSEPWEPGHRVWPAPADALQLEGQADLYRLDPAPPQVPTLGRDDDEAREALWVAVVKDPAKPVPSPRWWAEDRFIAWLTGDNVPANDPHSAFSLNHRLQVHVGIASDTLTAEEAVLFSHEVVETLESKAEWAVGAEVTLPDDTVPRLATLGSDSRIAAIEEHSEEVFEFPAKLLDAFRGGCRGLRLVVVTPACFQAGWLPDGFGRRDTEFVGTLPGVHGQVVLRAALVPRPMHISGWDIVAGTPKPTVRAVPPGAMYFLERLDGRPFDEGDARALWLAAIGGRTNEGFGRVVPGVWSPRRDKP